MQLLLIKRKLENWKFKNWKQKSKIKLIKGTTLFALDSSQQNSAVGSL